MGKPKFSLAADILVGVTMAATSIPQLIAYAETVGYAGYRGIATAGPSLLAWGFITGSPWINCGVTSVTAIMAKSDLDGDSYVSEFGESAYVKLVSAYSLYVGMASMMLALVGFGKFIELVPQSLRVGFKWGSSVGVLCAAIPNGLLVRGASTLKSIVTESETMSGYLSALKENFPAAIGATSVSKIFFVLTQPQLWALVPSVLFLACTIFVMRGKSMLPKGLPPGTEVIIVTIAATIFSINSNYEGGVVGAVPPMDSSKGIALFNGKLVIPIEVLDIRSLLFEVPLVERFGGSYLVLILSAFIFASVSFLQIVSIASSFETENDLGWSPTREVFAQGIACSIAGITGSAPVGGSLSRSLISRMAGATSQVACIITALSWICLQPYMSIMSSTPKAALSAVIVSAVIKGVLQPKALMKMKGIDSIIGWGTGIATMMASPTAGFAVGLLLTVIFHIMAKKPQTKKKREAL